MAQPATDPYTLKLVINGVNYQKIPNTIEFQQSHPLGLKWRVECEDGSILFVSTEMANQIVGEMVEAEKSAE